jgi:cobalt-zinc-cadmium efflux system membrane fusion protein
MAPVKRLLALALLVGCATREEHRERRPPAGEVWLSRQQIEAQQMRVEMVEEHVLETHLDAPGRIAFDDLRVAHVFPPVSGRILEIDAQPGQHVRKGSPLVELQSPDVGAAFADVEKAAADLVAAERELRRQRDLIEAQAGAQRDLDQARNTYERARAELARARQRANMFRERGADAVTQRFILRSPIDGEVISRNANPGTDVQGQFSGGNPPELFTVGSLDSVWAYADVFEVDLPRVRKGASVKVKVVAYPDRSFEGRLEWVSSALDPASRTARVRCTLDNPGHELSPEMYATVSISTPARRALALPRSAVLHVGDDRIVFVQTGTTENGLLRFQRRRVQLEETETDPAPVKSGVVSGDVVVVSGALLLSGML